MERISLDGSVFARSDICKLHVLVWTPDNSFIFDLGTKNRASKIWYVNYITYENYFSNESNRREYERKIVGKNSKTQISRVTRLGSLHIIRWYTSQISKLCHIPMPHTLPRACFNLRHLHLMPKLLCSMVNHRYRLPYHTTP